MLCSLVLHEAAMVELNQQTDCLLLDSDDDGLETSLEDSVRVVAMDFRSVT